MVIDIYARFSDHRYCHTLCSLLILVGAELQDKADRLLSQGYLTMRLEKSFKKFYGRYQDLIEKYQEQSRIW